MQRFRACPLILTLLLHAAQARPFRNSQLLEGGTVEPPPFVDENSTVYIGVWLPIRGLFAGVDSSVPSGDLLYGQWYGPLVIEAAFQSWQQGSVLLPPVETAQVNYQLVTFDSCPTPLGADDRCTSAHVAPYALALTQGTYLNGSDIPAVQAIIGGGTHAPLVAEIAGTRQVPLVDFDSELTTLSDKQRFPSYMRTNPTRIPELEAMAELIGVYMGYTRTNGLFCQTDEGLEVAETVLSLLAERGVQTFAFYHSPAQVSGWPSYSENDWFGFREYIPEISAKKFAERQATINEARIRNAHVWLNYLDAVCANADVVHEIALAGFEGPGYLWAGHYLDFTGALPLWFTVVGPYSVGTFGEPSPFFSMKPYDGYIGATSRTGGQTQQQDLLALAMDTLLTMNSTLEPWYRDELEPIARGDLLFDYHLYFLFDAMWAVLLSVNNLLLTHGGSTFDESDLHRQLLEVDFNGVSGRVRFNANGDRSLDMYLVQYHYCSSCNDSFALSEYLLENDMIITQLGTYDTEVLDLQQTMKFYDGILAPPPDLDLQCAPGLFYDRRGGRCRPCAPGAVTEVAGLHVCEQCVPGRVSRDWQQSGCESCPAGQYATEFGASACSACTIGSFAEAVQSTECIACSPGSVSNEVGSEFCQPCPAGSFIATAGETTCKTCETGSAAAEPGSSACEQCVPGTAVASASATSCVECDLGRYASGFGWSTCMNCSAIRRGATATMAFSAAEGRWINIQGATSEADCGCPRGSHNYTTSGECSPCSSEGVDCPGMGIAIVEPGYYSPASLLSVYRCYGDSKRCAGGRPGETCLFGRVGLTCALCKAGTTPTEDKTCQECKTEDYMPVVMTLAVVVPAIVAVYVFMSKAEDVKRSNGSLMLALVTSQIVSTFQHVSVLASFSVDWVDPVSRLLHVLSIISVKIQSLRLECWGLQSATATFLSQNFLIFICMLSLVMVHAVAVLYHRRRFGEQKHLLIGSFTVLLMFLYIPMVEMMLGPLQCRSHPNGKWTSRAFQTVTCWEGEEHTLLLTFCALTSLLPIGFFVHCVTVVWRFPEKVNSADREFLKAFSYLFFRYRPEMHWFVLVHLLRSFIIGILPVLPNAIAQVMTMQFIIICSAICNAYYMPWRVWKANLLDGLLGSYLVVLCLWASFFLDVLQEERRDIAWVLTISIVVATVVLGNVMLYALYMRYCRRTRTYKIVLCHRRGSAGALGRLLQFCAEQHLKSSFSDRSRTLLDCDLLAGLDELYDIIANDCKKMVVIACEQLWESELCIGELTIARLKAVPTVVMQLPKYRQPEPREVVEAAFNGGNDSKDLASHGIGPAMVEDTMQDFGNLPSVSLVDTLSNSYIEKLATVLAAIDCKRVKAVEFEPDHPGSGQDKCVCIIASMQEVEDAASAYLLLKYLARRLAMLPDLLPYVLPTDAEIGAKVRLVAVLFRAASTGDAVFLRSLRAVSHTDAAAIPIILDAIYKFPSHEHMSESCVKVLGEDEGQRLSDFTMEIFKEIACLFHPQAASLELMQVQADTIADRLTKPRLLKSSICSSDGDTSQAGYSATSGQPRAHAKSGQHRPCHHLGRGRTGSVSTPRVQSPSGNAAAGVGSLPGSDRSPPQCTSSAEEDDENQMAATESDYSHVSKV